MHKLFRFIRNYIIRYQIQVNQKDIRKLTQTLIKYDDWLSDTDKTDIFNEIEETAMMIEILEDKLHS